MITDRIVILSAMLTGLLLVGCSISGPSTANRLYSPPGTTTTVILVRHAERDDTRAISALTPKGQQRARDLVQAVGEMGITAIYSPNRGRNRETVQPLADHLGQEVRLIDNGRLMNTRKFADAFVRRVLAEHAGETVLWVGNRSPVGIWGGNLKEIHRRLDGEGKGPVLYSELFIITVPDQGEVKLEKTNYGEKVNRFNQ